MADPILQADPNAYAAALQSSPNFLNPQYATPEQIAALRATSTALMKDQPVHNWAEGLGSLAQYGVGLYLQNKAGQQQKDAIAQQQQMLVPQAGGAGGGNMLTTPPPSGDVPPASMAGGVGGTRANNGMVDPHQAASYYAANGLSPVAAAGLVGTLGGESQLNPNALKKGDGADGSNSIGMAQWNGPRAKALAAYAAKYGKAPNDPQIQLDFPLVEMGLKGNTSDPGFGTEAASGAALRAAKTPQDAAIAAVGYERPRGWSADNPTAASGFGRRMAITNALVGAGGAQQPAQAYGGAVPWPANKSTPAPAAQVAQAGGPPQGAGPLGGMGPQQIAAILANPWVDEKTKDMIRGMATPQVLGTPGGGSSVLVPGQGAKVTPAVGGVIPGSISVPGANVGTTTQLGPDGRSTTTLNVPGGGGAPGAPQNGNPLAPLAPFVKGGQDFQAAGQEQEGLVHQLGNLRDQGPTSKAALGQIATLEQLGDKVNDSGFVPMIQSEAAKHGIQLGNNLSDIQAYEAYANSILPSMRPPGSGSLGPDIPMFQAATGNLATTPEGRHIIANNMRMLHQYNAQVAEVAGQYDKTPQERWQAIQQIPVPKPITALPGQNGQGGPQTAPGTPQVAAQGGTAPPAATPSSGAPVMVTTPEEARKLAPGTRFMTPDRRVFTR